MKWNVESTGHARRLEPDLARRASLSDVGLAQAVEHRPRGADDDPRRAGLQLGHVLLADRPHDVDAFGRLLATVPCAGWSSVNTGYDRSPCWSTTSTLENCPPGDSTHDVERCGLADESRRLPDLDRGTFGASGPDPGAGKGHDREDDGHEKECL